MKNEDIKKIILVCGVGFFAIHSFYFISVLGVNYPYVDDWEIIKIGVAYHNNEPNWYEKIFEQANEHRPTVPRIIQTFSLFFDSFDLKNLMYLSWGLLIIAVYAFYGILKRADTRLTWLVVPISGFIFSPKQIDTLLFALGSLHWVIIFVSGAVAIYFLNDPNKCKKNIALAISVAITGTLTAILGLIIWIIGVFSFNPRHTNSRKFLILWSVIAVLVIVFYLGTFDINNGNITSLLKIESLISEEKILYVLNYISNPFSVKFTAIRIFIGISVIASIIISSVYLKYKIKYNEALPWIQFAGIGFLAALGTVLARSARSPFDTRYIIMSNFLEIAFMVLITMTILNLIKHYPAKKKILISILAIILISQMGLLGTGYYNGWNLAQERHMEMQDMVSCVKLPTDWESCKALIDQEQVSVLTNFVVEHRLNILADESFNKKNSDHMEILNHKIMNNDQIEGSEGIILINNKENHSVSVKSNEPLIIISGWIETKNSNQEINDVFLLIDEKPFVKVNLIDSDETNPQKKSWSTLFFAGYLEKGCHSVRAAGISAEYIIWLEDERELCL